MEKYRIIREYWRTIGTGVLREQIIKGNIFVWKIELVDDATVIARRIAQHHIAFPLDIVTEISFTSDLDEEHINTVYEILFSIFRSKEKIGMLTGAWVQEEESKWVDIELKAVMLISK